MNRHALLRTIGDTPMIALKRLFPESGINLFAKLEGQNPGGSIKDRAALHMIEQAERSGTLQEGKIIIEATSGNMGIALALAGAIKGYKVQIVMSEGMSRERQIMLKAFGAELILTPRHLGTHGAICRAKEIVGDMPTAYWFADQFNNPDNVAAHYLGIAEEMLKEVQPIDVLISGIGTGGTIMGIAKRFKEDSPATKIVGVIPMKGYGIQGLQHPTEDFSGSILDASLVDQLICASTEDAFTMCKKAAATEGLFVGMSSGAALFAATHFARSMKRGNIAAIIPDRGDKYLSTSLYE
jgi:cysteine synthase